jgi:hypothetical protein
LQKKAEDMHYFKLTEVISRYIDICPQDTDLVKPFFKYGSVTKGTSLIEFGMLADKVFLILSGYLKYFKIIESGEELIIHLFAPNNFATSLNSFFFFL